MAKQRSSLAMKLLVLGATGRTGARVVDRALDQGHSVRAVVRDPGKLAAAGDRLEVVKGSATDPAVLERAVVGQDAVVCAIGPRSPAALVRCDLMRSSMNALVPAMEREGVARLVLLSALGAGASASVAPVPLRLAFRTILHAVGKDKRESEHYVRASGLDWTIVYPPALTTGPGTGSYRAGEALRVSGVPKISRADLAEFMVGQVRSPTYRRKSAVVSS